MEKRTLVLLSGGIDSTVVATFSLPMLRACLFVDYGQPAGMQEERASRRWCDAFGIEWLWAKLPLDGLALRDGDGPRIVPGRNLALISLGISFALSRGCNEVRIGCNADDACYPDCRPEFIEAADALARVYGVRVLAPLVGMTKADVLTMAGRYGVNLGAAWTCYSPVDRKPCGACLACTTREAALMALAGQSRATGVDSLRAEVAKRNGRQP